MKIVTESILTCPVCGAKQKVTMPVNVCQYFYRCAVCNILLKPKKEDCCVFCSYSDTKCPPKQEMSYKGI